MSVLIGGKVSHVRGAGFFWRNYYVLSDGLSSRCGNLEPAGGELILDLLICWTCEDVRRYGEDRRDRHAREDAGTRNALCLGRSGSARNQRL